MAGHDLKHLWNGFAEGDEDLFRRLYRALYPGLLAYGMKLCADRGQVKDAINQTFLYLWEKRSSLGEVQQPDSYIYTSFRRRLVALISKQSPEISSSDSWPEEDKYIEASHEQVLVDRHTSLELQQVVARAIEKLPRRKQQLIRLKYYEGLSYKEIAARTGLSERTIYNKLHESVKALRSSLVSTAIPPAIAASILLLFN